MAGLLIPFQRDQATDFASASDARARVAKIRQVLGTSPGELPWRTSFGAGLNELRHQPNDAVLSELVRVRARDGLKAWLSDVSVTQVTVERDDTELRLEVRYDDGGAPGAVVV